MAGMKAPEAYFKLKTTVYLSGTVIESTLEKNALRVLGMPSGGKMILSNVALMSAAVNGSPSWNLTSFLILKVYVMPLFVAAGTSPSQRSQTKSVGDCGLSWLIRISRL